MCWDCDESLQELGTQFLFDGLEFFHQGLGFRV